MIDIHSHILPQLDDGARSLEEAIEMAEIAAADGITRMVATPHMFNGISQNASPTEILQRVADLQKAVGAMVEILPGNEVHVCPDMVDQVAMNHATKINHKNHVLVEFPQLMIPTAVEEMFRGLQLLSVYPILVHPERNVEIQNHPSIAADFIELGVLIQITAMSVTGEFGPAARTCAHTLLKHNCVHFIATDAHRSRRRRPVLSKARDVAAELVGQDRSRRLVEDHPLAVIEGRRISVEPTVPFTSRKRFLHFFER